MLLDLFCMPSQCSLHETLLKSKLFALHVLNVAEASEEIVPLLAVIPEGRALNKDQALY